MSRDRWTDCDDIDDPIGVLLCRTSKLNDGFHELVAWRDRVDWKLRGIYVGSFFAGLGGIAKLLEVLHGMGWL